MMIQISHQDAAKILAHGGGSVWVRGGEHKISEEDDSVLLRNVAPRGWVMADITVLELFQCKSIYVSGKLLPKLPEGFRWAGDNPMRPDRVERTFASSLGIDEVGASTYCTVAQSQIQRDIARAVADLWDQQHETNPAP